jgi:glycosyltransferase involved in cell wall biosynthesis
LVDRIAQLGSIVLKRVSKPLYTTIKNIYRSQKAIRRTRDIDEAIPFGVNLVGYFQSGMGLGEGCRLLARAIVAATIPLCAINFSRNNLSRQMAIETAIRLRRKPRYRATIVHVNPDQYPLFETELPRSLWRGRYVIGFLLWELTVLPESWREGLGLLDEIWTSSDFISDNIRSQVNMPVRTMHYGIPLREGESMSRATLGFGDGQFIFLVMYDIASIMERKNPRGAVDAFMRAFGPDDDRVGLIIKINNSRHAPAELTSLKELLHEYRDVRFMEESLPRSGVDALIRACDAVVSLHRAEGFGLVLAEAMSFGKPVVATNYSANIEFMDSSNSCPVNYTLIELDRDYGHYKAGGQYWAEPDIDHAASLMRRLVEDPGYRTSIGANAKERIRRDFSPEASGAKIAARLTELGLWIPPQEHPDSFSADQNRRVTRKSRPQ